MRFERRRPPPLSRPMSPTSEVVATMLDDIGTQVDPALDVLVSASGGLDPGSDPGYAMRLNRDAQVRLARLALPLLRLEAEWCFVTSHLAPLTAAGRCPRLPPDRHQQAGRRRSAARHARRIRGGGHHRSCVVSGGLIEEAPQCVCSTTMIHDADGCASPCKRRTACRSRVRKRDRARHRRPTTVVTPCTWAARTACHSTSVSTPQQRYGCRSGGWCARRSPAAIRCPRARLPGASAELAVRPSAARTDRRRHPATQSTARAGHRGRRGTAGCLRSR